MSSLKWLPLASVFLWGVPVASSLSMRLSKTSKWVWPWLLANYCLCAGTWSMWDFACLLRLDSISYCLLAFTYASPTGLQGLTFWGLVLPLQDPYAGEPDVCSLLLGENCCNCDYPLVCGSPTWGVGLDYTTSLPLLLIMWFLLYIFSYGKSFLLVFNLFSSIVAL